MVYVIYNAKDRKIDVLQELVCILNGTISASMCIKDQLRHNIIDIRSNTGNIFALLNFSITTLISRDQKININIKIYYLNINKLIN